MKQTRYISFSEISNLNISPEECLKWARTVIKNKNDYKLPAKTSIKFDKNNFFTTMPSMLPNEDIFGVKVVSRLLDRSPAIKADILLYKVSSGDLLALMDGTWITTWRTGAVAALTIDILKSESAKTYSFIGLGNTARATLLCMNSILSTNPCTNKDINVQLLSYKNQHEDFIKRFSNFKNIHFSVFDNVQSLIQHSDVIISSVTAMDSLFAKESDFKEGVLVVPIHTRGFQNCDLAFDRIFCDDISHIQGFKHFSEYKNVSEMTDVLNSSTFVRGGAERIIAYNIGISVQDIFFAHEVYKKICTKENEHKKYWI